MKSSDPRELAVHVLQQREQASEYTEDLLTRELARSPLSSLDRGLLQEITYGVVRWQATLDWLIARKTQGRTQKAALQILLRLGLYQLFWLERIPDHAAVNETVALAKRLGSGPQSGFINAILRGYLRERVATEQLLEELKVQEPSIGYSHPDWLFRRWEHRWGRDRSIELMQSNNRPPHVFARVNTLRCGPGQILEAWNTEGVTALPAQREWFPSGLMFELTSHPPLGELPSFQQGFFYVQDPSTLAAVHALNPAPNEQILDLCAAPGGKTTYIAQCMNNQGRISAEDLYPDRLKLVQENCLRLGVSCVDTTVNRGSQESGVLPDRVLLDAPCSNTGVMRRRVDLRWRIRREEIERLQRTQVALLQQAARRVKPGGIVVYSTCSLEPEENRQVVDQVLNENPALKLESERELLPFADGVDGAYVARMASGGCA